MSWIIILLIIDTVIQLFACHFTLWWIIAVIARILFCLRIVGATIKVKNLAIVEIVALACMFVFNMIFAKESFPWLRLLLFAFFSGISCLLMFLDDILYVYVTEDDED